MSIFPAEICFNCEEKGTQNPRFEDYPGQRTIGIGIPHAIEGRCLFEKLRVSIVTINAPYGCVEVDRKGFIRELCVFLTDHPGILAELLGGRK